MVRLFCPLFSFLTTLHFNAPHSYIHYVQNIFFFIRSQKNFLLIIYPYHIIHQFYWPIQSNRSNSEVTSNKHFLASHKKNYIFISHHADKWRAETSRTQKNLCVLVHLVLSACLIKLDQGPYNAHKSQLDGWEQVPHYNVRIKIKVEREGLLSQKGEW